MPPPVDLPAPSRPATDPEWRMSDPGPLPPPRGRRTWLWVAGGIVGACLLVCCLFWLWASTLGADWIEEMGTEISEQLTESPDETETPGQ